MFNAIYNGAAEIQPIEVAVASSIDGVEAVAEGSQPVYNLAGQRLQEPRKGLNIIGGKKVIVK